MKTLVALTTALLMGVAQGQEVCEGKVVIGRGVCADIRDDYPCSLMVDPEKKNAGWVVIFGKDGKPLFVVEMDATTGEQKVVWERSNQI